MKVSSAAEKVQEHLKQNVKGGIIPFSDESLAELCDYARIRKAYKCDVAKGGKADLGQRKEAEAFILGSMALKGS